VGVFRKQVEFGLCVLVLVFAGGAKQQVIWGQCAVLESEIEWFPLIRISYHFRKDIL
jgi:hypothetical protein